MYIGLHVTYPLLLSGFNETYVFSTGMLKHPNINIHEYPSTGSRIVPCRQIDGQTDRRVDRRDEVHSLFS